MSQVIPEVFRRVPRGRKLVERRPEQAAKRTRHQTVAALAGVPLFSGFGKRHLQRLAKDTDELLFDTGESVVSEGMPGEALFVVLAGHGKVVRRGRRVGEVVPGDFFGELSAIDGGVRTATVVADTPIRVLRLFRRTLLALLADEPQLSLKLLDGMVRRVREVERRTG